MIEPKFVITSSVKTFKSEQTLVMINPLDEYEFLMYKMNNVNSNRSLISLDLNCLQKLKTQYLDGDDNINFSEFSGFKSTKLTAN